MIRRRIDLEQIKRTGAAFAALVLLSAPALGQTLQNRIDQMMSDPARRTSRTGVILIDAQSGQTLAESDADDLFIPASNMKLLTSGVALVGLKSQFVFRTELMVDPTFTGPDGTRGRVILRGSGDPALGDPKLLEAMGMSAGDIIEAWTTALTKAGLQGPVGELVIDDRIFDRQFVHPSWPVQQLNRWYCAEVAGLNFHANLLLIYTEPHGADSPPSIRTDPEAPWIQIRNRAESVSRGNHTAWAARALQSNEITLQGDVRWATDPVELALHDIPTFIGRLLGNAMTQAGLEPRAVRLAGENEQLPAGKVVHLVTTDMQTVLRRCNVNSYNLYAECLLKRLGHEMTQQPGSWSTGASFMRMMLLEKVGAIAGQVLTIADGSGMSRENRVSPRLMAEWLRAMLDEPERSMFLESLPSANMGEGTLAKRFRAIPLRNDVRAKTGYLTGVSALSGYVMAPGTGKGVIFSIITNEKPNSVRLSLVRDMEERIVQLADDWLTEHAAAVLGQAGE